METAAKIIERAVDVTFTQRGFLPSRHRDAIMKALDEAGYAVVPKEPTDEMADKGIECLSERNDRNGAGDAKTMYRVMVKAASDADTRA